MITAERIEGAIEDWIFQLHNERQVKAGRTSSDKPTWWSPDWSDWMWHPDGHEFEIPGLESPLIFRTRYVPAGEDFDDFSGPQYLIYEYEGRFFAKAGRNISHDGASFEGQFYEVHAVPETRTHWVRNDDLELPGELENPEA